MIVEVLCGNVEDCIIAHENGAHRIELNSGTLLGGLTPSLGTFRKAKQLVNIPIMVMIRPRGAGFCYSEIEFQTMMDDARIFLEEGAEGIVFGFLNEDKTVDIARTKSMVDLIHSYQKEAVFHRAIDQTLDIDQAMQTLVNLNIDRVLTSGGEDTVHQGLQTITDLQSKYGNKIEILPGSGVSVDTWQEILDKTQCNQIHGSFKIWQHDPTTHKDLTKTQDYYTVDPNQIKALFSKP